MKAVYEKKNVMRIVAMDRFNFIMLTIFLSCQISDSLLNPENILWSLLTIPK